MAKTRTETDSFGPIDVPADDLTSIMARWVVNR
jgi:fumarate hydratase class II